MQHSPHRTVGGKIIRERLRTHLVANPGNRHIIPVETQLWHEQTVRKKSHHQKNQRRTEMLHRIAILSCRPPCLESESVHRFVQGFPPSLLLYGATACKVKEPHNPLKLYKRFLI